MNRMHPHILWYLGSIQFLSLHKIIWQVKVVVVNSLDNKSCGGKGPYEELGWRCCKALEPIHHKVDSKSTLHQGDSWVE